MITVTLWERSNWSYSCCKFAIAFFHDRLVNAESVVALVPWWPQGTLGASCGALPHRQRRQCRRIRGRHGRGAVPLTPCRSRALIFVVSHCLLYFNGYFFSELS